MAWSFCCRQWCCLRSGRPLHPADPIAFRMLQIFFQQLGATGGLCPLLAVVGDPADLAYRSERSLADRFETLWGMALESVALAMPLLALGISVARWNIHIPLGHIRQLAV
jgi:hypothetical protein